jgi:hypothetical protein
VRFDANELSNELGRAYSWCPDTDRARLAEALASALQPNLTARGRASTMANMLSGWGLPVSADLLVSLAGGSKSMAVEVLRATYLTNAARAARSQTPTPMQPPPSASLADLGPVNSRLDTISKDVGYLVGQLNWIHRSIDTERQLARQMQTSSGPHLASAPSPSRAQVIDHLLADLNEAKAKGA